MGSEEYINHHFWDVIFNYALGLGPLGPVVNLSKGFANLFYQPYVQYQTNGRLLRGVKQGVSDFGVTLASESLNITSKVASGSQMILQLTDDCLNMLRPDASKTGDDSVRYAAHPESAAEGIQQGLNSLKRESATVYRHLFVVPVEEYNNHGTGGAVNAFVHALPIAVLRPAIGIVESAKQVGIGARNQIDSRETKATYKDN
eukprot:CAMPEP_0117013278 /NCGR_PEP_ID=MMETSP0472-20121206/10989_1 /TAXON_ID=693140 ORGANISM="Tiarina fusus, Strain LIS" /NCGR_SAMPLE_ID=MMETSP0472 /ASSEMBLY_ACC=CAM_ASM_000603 /LENGTH=201 /DNA_ID=CAMNT_0004716549 /DNA_START=80 /DNA_END=685 /DNA_ORIENTATION=-